MPDFELVRLKTCLDQNKNITKMRMLATTYGT